MKDIFELLKQVGTLKEKPRRGWVIHDIEDPETTAEHSFHLVFLVWILGRSKKDFDLERAMKIATIHDLCEVHSPDITPSDTKGLKEDPEEKEIEEEKFLHNELNKGYPTTEQRRRMEKIKKRLEQEGMDKLLQGVSSDIKGEIWELWEEYEKGLTKEAKFVKQADKTLNLFQGMEYYKKYGRIEYELWIKRAKEVIDDPVLLKLLTEIENDIEKKD